MVKWGGLEFDPIEVEKNEDGNKILVLQNS